MNWVDFSIVGILAVSALIGLARGLVREMLSLGVWVAALGLGWLYRKPVADLLTPHIDQPSVRLAIAFAGIALVVLVVGAVLGWLLSLLVQKARLSWADRALGLVFGAARGAVLVAMAVYLGTLTPMPDEAWWKESRSIGQFQSLADWMLSLVPPEVQAQLKKV
jgi:membrane protein required for colicin V production